MGVTIQGKTTDENVQEVLVDEQGRLITVSSGGSTAPTASYGYCAKSETATHQYLFYEDSSANWYVLRKNLSTDVVDYGKGIGGYQSVYVDKNTAPTPAPTYDTYGATF
jgi:hypothetical protein